MTVKELFQSLEFKDIIEPMTKKHPDALLPISEYKENYSIILNTVFSGEGGKITFLPDGNSDAYMIEGDRYFNIVGMEVVLPENGVVTKAEAAAEILWCSAPFGRAASAQWEYLYEELLNPEEADFYALQAKRVDLQIALPYCRDKKIQQELKCEMKSSYDELSLSGKATDWFIFGKGKLWGRKHNRSKRKREYRLEKRYNELVRLNDAHKRLTFLKATVGAIPHDVESLILKSSAIETVSYQSYTYGNSDRIEYIADLLLNPIYRSQEILHSRSNIECICILFSSSQRPFSSDEQSHLRAILDSYFQSVSWHLFISCDDSLGNEIELEICYIKTNDLGYLM